jgi:2-C-methyl-D-erythritol 4-phosphate cytidylyltransferase
MPALRYHALIVAAGTGVRFASETPKQYALLDGKPLLQHAIDRLAAGMPMHRTYVAIARTIAGTNARFVPTRRSHRSAAAAQRARRRCATLSTPSSTSRTTIGSSSTMRRGPCVDRASLARLQRELADEEVGGLLAIPVVSALKRADDSGHVAGTLPRAGVWQAQTPQMFRYGILRDALARPGSDDAVDCAQAVEALGMRARLVPGNPNNLKISYPEDMVLAAAILATERGEQR